MVWVAWDQVCAGARLISLSVSTSDVCWTACWVGLGDYVRDAAGRHVYCGCFDAITHYH